MISRLIEWSVRNKALVLMLTVLLGLFGAVAARNIRLDAIPDLSDVQVIVTTEYPGQNPQVVDDQVTLPLSTALLSVPGATTVRGYSMFEQSFVYVLFEDGTDLYWARSRVLEYLSKIQPLLPQGVTTELGPDATGVGWVFQYALIDESGRNSSADLRAFQDWNLRYRLQSVPGVAEVAVVGLPHPKWGERPHALVVLHADAQVEQADLTEHIQPFIDQGQLSKWAMPEDFVFVTAIPKTSVGKIDKKRIRSEWPQTISNAANENPVKSLRAE